MIADRVKGERAKFASAYNYSMGLGTYLTVEHGLSFAHSSGESEVAIAPACTLPLFPPLVPHPNDCRHSQDQKHATGSDRRHDFLAGR